MVSGLEKIAAEGHRVLAEVEGKARPPWSELTGRQRAMWIVVAKAMLRTYFTMELNRTLNSKLDALESQKED